MPSIAQLLPLLGKDYERKCIELRIIRRAREMTLPALKGGVSSFARKFIVLPGLNPAIFCRFENSP